jgi:hypothetical protein
MFYLATRLLNEDITMLIHETMVRPIAKVAFGLGSLILLAGDAGAVDGRVSSACASDYLAYCSQHDPDGPGTRRCMRANGLKLSQACVNALVAAGEVSKREVARRASAK